MEPGRRAAEVMTLGGTPEMEAIAARFKEGARKNQAWFEQYTAQHAGKTLPWHANMGITPEEYQAFLQSKGTLSMHKQIDTILVIEEDGQDVALSTGGKWKFFDDLKARIRKDASQGNTVLGPLSRKVQVVASEAQSTTGPWGGSCWRASELTGLCLGKTSSGRGILTYEARTAGDARPQANSDPRFTLLVKGVVVLLHEQGEEAVFRCRDIADRNLAIAAPVAGHLRAGSLLRCLEQAVELDGLIEEGKAPAVQPLRHRNANLGEQRIRTPGAGPPPVGSS
ncbi:MAG: hypothetical protein ABI895_40715 [Deltaproteobacteria bacterium]